MNFKTLNYEILMIYVLFTTIHSFSQLSSMEFEPSNQFYNGYNLWDNYRR